MSERRWVLLEADPDGPLWINESNGGLWRADQTEEDDLVPHPALPAIAKLLHEPEFAANVIEASRALEWLAVDFADASGESNENAPPLVALRRLAAAIAGEEDGDGL